MPKKSEKNEKMKKKKFVYLQNTIKSWKLVSFHQYLGELTFTQYLTDWSMELFEKSIFVDFWWFWQKIDFPPPPPQFRGFRG